MRQTVDVKVYIIHDNVITIKINEEQINLILLRFHCVVTTYLCVPVQ